MIDGTKRAVLELLYEEGPRSPTEVAESMGVSVQTASRNLRDLAERGFVRVRRPGDDDHRGYKVYDPVEFASVFAGMHGTLFERDLDLTAEKRAILSVWQVPQAEFHPVLSSYLFGRVEPGNDELEFDVTALAVYGSVARGEAKPDSDVDVFGIAEGIDGSQTPFNRSFIQDGGPLGFGSECVISETWYRERELVDGLESGSSFLANVLEEAILLHDPGGVLSDARQIAAGKRVSRPG